MYYNSVASITLRKEFLVVKKSIVGLKGILSLVIFFYHLHYQLVFDGQPAVTYFFIISGFLMALGYKNKFVSLQPSTYFSFQIKRLVKLYPLQVLIFLISLLCIYFENAFVNIKIGVAIKNLLLLQSLTNLGSNIFSFNEVSWYLSTTIVLYLLTPFIIYFINKCKLGENLFKLTFSLIVVFLAGVAIAYYGIDNMEPYSNGWWFIYISPYYRIFDYLIGILLGYIFAHVEQLVTQNKIQLNSIVFSCIEILTLIMTFYLIHLRVIFAASISYDMFYVPFAVLFIFVISFQKGIISALLSSKILLYIGTLSFEIYMLHKVFMRIIAGFLNLPLYGFPENGRALFVHLSLLLVVIVFSDFINNRFVKPLSTKLLALKSSK